MNKFFSIITPVYNRSKYLEKTIKSVLNQKYKNFEYIIVDGKSNDRTSIILNKYKSKINIISEKDHGMYDAIKKGFKVAKGKYFMWLNSDDFLKDNCSLLNAYNYLKKYKKEWITGNISFVTESEKKIKTYFPLIYPRFIIKAGLAHGCFWGFIQQENTIFSQRLYKKSGGINNVYKMAGDYDLWRRFANFEKITPVPISIAVQRKWKGQLTSDMDFYYSEINKKKCLFNFFYIFRFLLSVIFIFKFFFLGTFNRSQKETNR
jgi:glycosyltransferase involved in cell wall biosynthesis